MKETDVAKALIRWLDVMGWEVYQEVQPGAGAIADVVATCGRLLWVIEVKNGLTTAVVDQAAAWLGFSHYVSVCTPYRRATKGRRVLEEYMGIQGIGAHERLVLRQVPQYRERRERMGRKKREKGRDRVPF